MEILYMKKFGDRKDGKRIKNVSSTAQMLIDLKPGRCNSDVYINQKMDVTELVKYVEKKKKDNPELTYFHAFVAAIGMLYYNRRKLNWFVSNRHIYEHNDVIISFVAKNSLDDNSNELMVMVPIDPKDNIDTLSEKIKNKVDAIRNKKHKKVGANNAIDTLAKLPNVIRVPFMGLLKWCDKKGILPSSLVKDNLYYSSIIVSNLGSIKCGAIYHNITNFGSCSALATMGEIKKEEIINEDDKKEKRSLCEFGINIDERIADGFYFAKSIKMLQYIFDNPELLEHDASEKIEMK